RGPRGDQPSERAVAAGHDDEGARIREKHRLAHEEVAEVHPEFDVVVQAGLEGQLDAQADGQSPAVYGTEVAGFHDALPTAGDDGVSRLGEPARDLTVVGIDLIVRVKAGGAEE